MCNPRRVTITATRELDEAWRHEVARTVQLAAEVAGEARVREPLAETLGAPALAALEMALAEGDPEWREVDGRYRHEVEGGGAVYDPEEQTLEIVAARTDRVEARGTATAELHGTVQATVAAEGASGYYEDGWRGYTRERAEEDAERVARGRLDEAARREVEAAREAAAAQAAPGIAARAEERAREELERSAEATRTELRRQAAAHLEAVGLRCRQAFHRLLARAYRDALLAYARRQGAEVLTSHDDDGILEIELRWSR
jgi:hypothetical protein